jgi:hypothetical protein
MKANNEKLIINAGILLIAYFGFLRPLMTKFGITKSSSDKLIDSYNNLPNTENPFSPNFWKVGPVGRLLLTTAIVDNFIKKIYNSFGVFTDDEATVISVFRQLKSKSQVSYLSDKFQQKYNTDLLTYLQKGYSSYNLASGLSVEELQIIFSIVNSLPKYK